MFSPGDVVGFYSDIAGKDKFHLCLSLNGCFFFLNSPKVKTYPSDLIIPCTELPFLEPTPSGDSIISCSVVVRMTPAELKAKRARLMGKVSPALLTMLLTFVENSTVLSQEDKDAVIDGLGEWI